MVETSINPVVRLRCQNDVCLNTFIGDSMLILFRSFDVLCKAVPQLVSR